MPDWIDSELLRQAAVVVSGVLVVGCFVVWRLVQKVVLRVIGVGVMLGLAAGMWFYRAELGDCAETCSCSLFGADVTVPACEGR